MSIILFNGSPKGNVVSSGSYQIIKAMTEKMESKHEICAIVNSDYEKLYQKVEVADYVLFVIPLYIHSVPSFVLDFLYHLPEHHDKPIGIGYIIQSGFPESSESEIASRFLERLTKKHGYDYLGTVIKGECAGLALMPERYKKLLAKFTEFGLIFDQTKTFDEKLKNDFANPVYLSKFQTFMCNAMIPLSHFLGWNRMLKKHGAFDKRLDRPYLEK